MSRRVAAVHTAVAALVGAALFVTVRDGVRQPAVALAFGLLIVVGETVRVKLPGSDHPVGPLAAAGALGYALLGEIGPRPAEHDMLQVVAVMATALGLTPHLGRVSRIPVGLRRLARHLSLPAGRTVVPASPTHPPRGRQGRPPLSRRARTTSTSCDPLSCDVSPPSSGWGGPIPRPFEPGEAPPRHGRRRHPRGCGGAAEEPRPLPRRSEKHVLAPRQPLGRDHLARRLLTVAFAAACFQPLHDWVDGAPHSGSLHAVLLLVVLLLTAGCDAVLAAALTAGRHGCPYAPLLRDGLRAAFGIVPALAATGAVLALAVGAGGLWALPVCWVPLLLVQFAVGRYAAVRATYRQTIASLARATEVAGYTPHGHARRVAALSRAMARELRLTEPELTILEYAALMHDIGQLSLLDPLAGGATEPLEEAERRRIAQLGGAVVRQTGVPAEVALVVERQADPWREQPLTARVVRVANAYEDLASGQDAVAGPLRVLERMRLSGARDYDPRVVEALARVVTVGDTGPTASSAG